MSDEIVIGPVRPPDPAMKVGPGPAGLPGKWPAGCVNLASEDYHPQLRNIAAKFLKEQYGALVPFRINEKYYMARVEPHYRKPTTNPTLLTERKSLSIPEGWHKGVSVFKVPNSNKIDKPTENSAKPLEPSEEKILEVLKEKSNNVKPKIAPKTTTLLDRINYLLDLVKF